MKNLLKLIPIAIISSGCATNYGVSNANYQNAPSPYLIASENQTIKTSTGDVEIVNGQRLWHDFYVLQLLTDDISSGYEQ